MSPRSKISANSSSIAVFGEALPAKPESSRRRLMKRQHKSITATSRMPAAPRQLALAFGAPQLWMMPSQDRQRAVARLASLLMQAAGVAPAEEDRDDRR
jgi:hypothetical protein